VTLNSGYKYRDIQGKDMVEYNVDSSNAWEEKVTIMRQDLEVV
jgi:hypothetical protein